MLNSWPKTSHLFKLTEYRATLSTGFPRLSPTHKDHAIKYTPETTSAWVNSRQILTRRSLSISVRYIGQRQLNMTSWCTSNEELKLWSSQFPSLNCSPMHYVMQYCLYRTYRRYRPRWKGIVYTIGHDLEMPSCLVPHITVRYCWSHRIVSTKFIGKASVTLVIRAQFHIRMVIFLWRLSRIELNSKRQTLNRKRKVK